MKDHYGIITVNSPQNVVGVWIDPVPLNLVLKPTGKRFLKVMRRVERELKSDLKAVLPALFFFFYTQLLYSLGVVFFFLLITILGIMGLFFLLASLSLCL